MPGICAPYAWLVWNGVVTIQSPRQQPWITLSDGWLRGNVYTARIRYDTLDWRTEGLAAAIRGSDLYTIWVSDRQPMVLLH